MRLYCSYRMLYSSCMRLYCSYRRLYSSYMKLYCSYRRLYSRTYEKILFPDYLSLFWPAVSWTVLTLARSTDLCTALTTRHHWFAFIYFFGVGAFIPTHQEI